MLPFRQPARSAAARSASLKLHLRTPIQNNFSIFCTRTQGSVIRPGPVRSRQIHYMDRLTTHRKVRNIILGRNA